MILEARNHNPRADGMVVEVNANDTRHSSATIALHYLSMHGAMNEGRPSVPLQLFHALNASFPDRRTEDPTIRYFRPITEVNQQGEPLHPVPGRSYEVRNGAPIEIMTLKIENDRLVEKR